MTPNVPRATANVEGVLSAWLRDDPKVASIVGQRVYTVLPKTDKGHPRVLIERTGGNPRAALFLDRVDLRITVWTGRMAEAEDLASAVVTALTRIDQTVYRGVAFSRIQFRNLTGGMDGDFTPALSRMYLDLSVWARNV